MTEEFYTMSFGPDMRLWFADAEDPEPREPPDWYRFITLDFPPDLRQLAFDEMAAGTPMLLEDLVDAGIDTVHWRQSPMHVMPDAISRNVFDALSPLSDGGLGLRSTITIVDFSKSREYCLHTFPHMASGPFFQSADLSRSPELAGIEPRTVLSVWRQRQREGLPTTVWFPRSILDKPRLLSFEALSMTVLATPKLVEAYKATEISKYLQSAPWEFDIHFEPFPPTSYGQSLNIRFFDDNTS